MLLALPTKSPNQGLGLALSGHINWAKIDAEDRENGPVS